MPIDWTQLNGPQAAPTPAQSGAIDWNQVSQAATKPVAANTAPAPGPAQSPPAGGVLSNIGDFASAGWHHLQKGLHGAAQLIENGADDAMQNAGWDNVLSNYWHSSRTKDDAAMKKWEDDYQASTANSPGAYAGATVGEIVNPVNRIMKVGQGGYLATALQGAAQGAISGAATPDTTGGGNYWDNKLSQIGTGAAVGGVLGPTVKAIGDNVITPAIGYGSKLLAALKPNGDTTAAGVIGAINDAATNGGIDTSNIPASVMASIKQQVANAQASGQKLDVAAALRKAQFDALGVDPLLGQITRDPVQYTQELDLRGLPGGEPIAGTLNSQNKQLLKVLANQGADATAPTPYAAGSNIMQKLVSDDATRKAAVDAAYGAVRDSAGRAMPLDHVGFVGNVNDALDQGMLGAELPESVRNTLNNISQGNIPFNVNTALQWDKVLSANQQAAQGSAKAAIGVVRNAIQQANPGEGAGADTINLYNTARNMAAQRFQMIDSNPALKAALDEGAPEDFINKYVINGKVNDVQNLMKLSGDQGETIKQQVVNWLQNKATGGNALDENARFSAARYSNALNNIPPEKLATIFSPDEIGTLKNLKNVSGYIQNEPVGGAVNRSNTASAVSQLVAKVGQLPWINKYVADPLEKFQTGAAAKAATAAKIPAQPPASAAALSKALSIGVGAPAAAAANGVNDR
jgi:hypothetical protein